MSQPTEQVIHESEGTTGLRAKFAASLGVTPRRKEEIYLSLSNSSSLRDTSYWLQIFFAAGIATLGLILNSPAVIIGAMLISPLMGPILACGLALAVGDVVLALRALVILGLSCLAAVLFAVGLVWLLPFKELTNEISARIQPTTLDLVVALFSGAVGSVATCKEVKGIVTSIPGVAIAVALMPPLCVVGYGIGVAVSQSGSDGMRVAAGGGLLFLTNLVAITFTAMIVFLLLHIDTRAVKQRVEEWRAQDQESVLLGGLAARIPLLNGGRTISRLSVRLLMIVVPILVLMVPLSRSFTELKQEIASKKQENRVRRTATELWKQQFEKLPDGEPRSYIERITIAPQNDKVAITLTVFTSKLFTASERTDYVGQLASKLGQPLKSIAFQLVEIPTASSDLAAKAKEEKPREAPLTVAQLQSAFVQGLDAALGNLRLPPPAQLVTYSTISTSEGRLRLVIRYLSDRDIGMDARSLIIDDVKVRLGDPATIVEFERVSSAPIEISFERNQATLTSPEGKLLDSFVQTAQQYPSFAIEIIGGEEKNERTGIANERAETVVSYLTSKSTIAPSRLTRADPAQGSRKAIVRLKLASATQ